MFKILRLAKQISKKQPNTYRYVFDYVSEFANPAMKVFHASDLAYTFHITGGLAPEKYNENEEKLSEMIIDYWVNFAKTGNPSPAGSKVPNWPIYSEQNRKVQKLGIPIETLDSFREEKLALWDKIYPR